MAISKPWRAMRRLIGSAGPSRRYAVLLILAGVPMTFDAGAQSDQSDRVDRVKAAFVLNIARFVTWPDGAFMSQESDLSFCLYRDNPIHRAVEMLQNEAVAGRRITVNRIETWTESGTCHIMLIARQQLRRYLDEARSEEIRPVLTIVDLTDSENVSAEANEALVTLVRNDKRIGFQINLGRSLQAGLKMSSQLLKLATIVGEKP
ncbi:MAG: hypothetical protein Kow0065_15550 [Methylomicrobium sp.]